MKVEVINMSENNNTLGGLLNNFLTNVESGQNKQNEVKKGAVNMELDNVLAKTVGFIKLSTQRQLEFVETGKEFDERVKQGRMGAVDANEKLSDLKNNIISELYNSYDVIYDEIGMVLEQEVARINQTSEAITADGLAELTLLNQLELSTEDINKYAEKYKHNPLAIRKLKDIAFDKQLMGSFPTDRTEYIQKLLNDLKEKIKKFSTPSFDNKYVGQKIEFISEGTIQSIEKDVAYYKSL